MLDTSTVSVAELVSQRGNVQERLFKVVPLELTPVKDCH